MKAPSVLARLRLDRRDQRGLTLVELLITTVVLGVIIGALSAGLVVGFTTTQETTDRLNESNDAQLVSAYLANDAQGAESITATACGSGTPLVTFQYEDSNLRVSWYFETIDGESRIVRRSCSGGSVQEEIVVARFASGGVTALCDGVACDPATRPRPDLVTLTSTEGSGYSFSVSGSRRPYAPLAGPPAKSPLQFAGLGTGSNRQLRIEGRGRLTVKGNLYVDCCAGSPEPAAPDLIYLDPNPHTRLSIDGKFGIYGYPTRGGCNGCAAGRVTSANPTPHEPQPFAVHLVDPFAHVAYPDVAGMPVYTNGQYQGPGVYRTLPLRITSNTVLAAGTYALERGIEISSGAIVTGTGVVLFNGCGRNAPSTCAANRGSFALSGNNGGGSRGCDATPSVRLEIEPPTSGPYKDVVFFQEREHTANFSVSGQASFISTRGIIYAPGATRGVDLGSGTSCLKVKGILATAMRIAGQGEAIVG